MRRLRILLLRPRPPKETIGLQHVMICEPLELEYLAGNLDERKYKVQIVDMILEKHPIEYFLQKYQPDLVGMTGYITHVGSIKALAKRVKNVDKDIWTVVGGVHAEVLPKDFACPYIDHIICEDPIGTFIHIAEELRERKKGKAGEGEKPYVPGTYLAGKVHRRSAAFAYAPPDRAAVSRYRRHYYYMFHRPCALIKTSFGCPYHCSFCFCKEVTGGKYFARDVEAVIAEIESIAEKEIYIVDDDFLFDERRLKAFCEALEEKKIRKNFLVYGRADFIAGHRDLMRRLARNGLRAVIVGIESLRERDLEAFHKKSSPDKHEQAIRILQECGIELYATMIMQPDFTKEDFDDIAKYLIRMDVLFVNLQPLTPLPGTDIYEEYKERILVRRSDYARWDLAHVVLQPAHMSIREYYYRIIQTYYRVLLRPGAIKRMLGKYGVFPVLRMWWGSQFVSMQYIIKMIKGS